MKSSTTYKKINNEYKRSKIKFEYKKLFFEKVTDIPLALLSMTLRDNFRNYLISNLNSPNSIGGGTNMISIDFYDEWAYIIDEVWYLFADRTPEKLKIKKANLLKFFNIWIELENKGVSEIILRRENDKLIIEGDGIFYSSSFEITEPQNDFLFSFVKENNTYQIQNQGCEVCRKDNYIVLDIMSNLLQKKDINLIKQDIKSNQKYVSKEITIINDLETGWTNIAYGKYKNKILKVVSEDFPSFLDFWQWLLSQNTKKINLMIEDNLITLNGNYLYITVQFELEEKN